MANVEKIGTATLTTPVLAGGVTNSSITSATTRPYSLATMDADSNLLYNAINRKLEIESTLDDIFVNLGADVVFTGKKVMVPDACIMRLSAEGAPGRTRTIPFMNPLAGPGRGGSSEDQQGYERNTTVESMVVRYNEYSQAVMMETWGVHYNDLDLIGYYAEQQPALSKWFAEDEGKQYREALLETYAWPLEKAPITQTQSFNPNWFIANTEFGSQPTYSATAGTFRTNITTAFAAADTGTNGSNANIDLNYLVALDHYAQTNKLIDPVTIGGKKSYVVLIPSSQLHKLRQVTSGQLGSVWQEVSALSTEEQNFPGVVGRVMSLLIVEDQRYPTIACTNSYANNTMTVTYCEPGNTDSRNKSVYAAASNADWDIGFLMGRNALTDWKVKPLHFAKESSEYGKRYGYGAFTERGIQLTRYDLDTAGNAMKNKGSIILAFTAPTIVTTA